MSLSLPLEEQSFFSTENLPLFDQDGYTKSIWKKNLKTTDHLNFFFKTLIFSLNACLKEHYTKFDAHTTSNCCHGLAILARGLIIESKKHDLQNYKDKCQTILARLENSHSADYATNFLSMLPGPIIDLVSLYVLGYAVKIDPSKGKRTVPTKLKELSQVGTKFCKRLIKHLQKEISNIVANGYEYYLSQVSDNQWIGGTTVGQWGQYATKPWLRIDKRKIRYAPCLFSMQIVISYLQNINARIVLLNEIKDHKTQDTLDYLFTVLQKNDAGYSIPVSEKNFSSIACNREPIIVFAGYSFVNKNNVTTYKAHMQPWLDHFSSLILACDTNYPQFPSVNDDLGFDSSQIEPSEASLKSIIREYSYIKGTTANNPSLFCLSHIFPSSLHEVLTLCKKQKTNHSSSMYSLHETF